MIYVDSECHIRMSNFVAPFFSNYILPLRNSAWRLPSSSSYREKADFLHRHFHIVRMCVMLVYNAKRHDYRTVWAYDNSQISCLDCTFILAHLYATCVVWHSAFASVKHAALEHKRFLVYLLYLDSVACCCCCFLHVQLTCRWHS